MFALRVDCCDLDLTAPLWTVRFTRTGVDRVVTLGACAAERVELERGVLGRALLGRD